MSKSTHALSIAMRDWRRVRPIDRITASSWRRRRTVVTSAWATVADASNAKNSLLEVKSEIEKLKAEKDRMLAQMASAQARVKIQNQLEGLSVDFAYQVPDQETVQAVFDALLRFRDGPGR